MIVIVKGTEQSLLNNKNINVHYNNIITLNAFHLLK